MKAVDFTTEGGNTGCEIAFHYSRSLLTTLRRRGWFVLHMPTPTRREPSGGANVVAYRVSGGATPWTAPTLLDLRPITVGSAHATVVK
jgi:hypothetical protein